MSSTLVAIQAGIPRVSQGTSRAALERVHGALPDGRVSVGWLYRELDAEATYLLIFVLALLGALPGASLPAGLAICALAGRMMLTRGPVVLPEAIAVREIAAGPARYALARAIAVLRVCERMLPQKRGDASAMRPVAGALLFILGALLLVPIPLSNVAPALAAAAISLALVEGSFMLFVMSSAGVIASFALMAVTVSATASYLF